MTAPTHTGGPRTEREAAQAALPFVRSQLLAALQLIVEAGSRGVSNRQIQRALYDPAQPAWNKVPTRTKRLADKGYAELRVDGHEETIVRVDARTGRSFLVYFPTEAGVDFLLGTPR